MRLEFTACRVSPPGPPSSRFRCRCRPPAIALLAFGDVALTPHAALDTCPGADSGLVRAAHQAAGSAQRPISPQQPSCHDCGLRGCVWVVADLGRGTGAQPGRCQPAGGREPCRVSARPGRAHIRSQRHPDGVDIPARRAHRSQPRQPGGLRRGVDSNSSECRPCDECLPAARRVHGGAGALGSSAGRVNRLPAVARGRAYGGRSRHPRRGCRAASGAVGAGA